MCFLLIDFSKWFKLSFLNLSHVCKFGLCARHRVWYAGCSDSVVSLSGVLDFVPSDHLTDPFAPFQFVLGSRDDSPAWACLWAPVNIWGVQQGFSNLSGAMRTLPSPACAPVIFLLSRTCSFLSRSPSWPANSAPCTGSSVFTKRFKGNPVQCVLERRCTSTAARPTHSSHPSTPTPISVPLGQWVRSPLPIRGPEGTYWQKVEGNYEAPLICSHSLRNYGPAYVHKSKNFISYLLSNFLVVYIRSASPVLVTPHDQQCKLQVLLRYDNNQYYFKEVPW